MSLTVVQFVFDRESNAKRFVIHRYGKLSKQIRHKHSRDATNVNGRPAAGQAWAI
jgi:hypothetical protein